MLGAWSGGCSGPKASWKRGGPGSEARVWSGPLAPFSPGHGCPCHPQELPAPEQEGSKPLFQPLPVPQWFPQGPRDLLLCPSPQGLTTQEPHFTKTQPGRQHVATGHLLPGPRPDALVGV